MFSWLNLQNYNFDSFNFYFWSCITISLVFSLSYNFAYYNKIKFLENENINFRNIIFNFEYDKKVLNTEILILQNKLPQNALNLNKFDNINNWNLLFNKDVYDIYFQSEFYKDYIFFSKEEFLTLSVLKIMQLELLQYRTNIAINKIIFSFINPYNIRFNFNNFNSYILTYENNFYFDKVKLLYLDSEINNLLYKKYANNYPFYQPHYTLLKYLITDNSVPYSFSPTYTKKFYFNNMYSGLNYTNKNISEFS